MNKHKTQTPLKATAKSKGLSLSATRKVRGGGLYGGLSQLFPSSLTQRDTTAPYCSCPWVQAAKPQQRGREEVAEPLSACRDLTDQPSSVFPGHEKQNNCTEVFLHCSSMFSLYIAKKRRCKIVTGTEEEENMTLVIPTKASQGFQPEIWQFSDKRCKDHLSFLSELSTSSRSPCFLSSLLGVWEFLVLLSVLAAAAFSPPTVCICQPLVQMSLSFILCCSVFMESLPWNDLESHSCSPPSDLLP